MVNRPEPTRRPRRKKCEAPGADGAIQLEMLDYIYTDEELQEAERILLGAEDSLWRDLAREAGYERSH